MPPRDPAVPVQVTLTEPQIRLRLLGPVDLRDAAGSELVAVVRQPKRLALLAFLALRPGSRWIRRDELLATFWPDLDTGHARASLRRALYFLRQELGEGVVAGRGEELGVVPAALWCDVTAYREAIAAREWARALELYRGDLLQGMFIAGADEAEQWLERERGALRAAAGEAAGVLATSAGGWEAVEWSRRALALSPCEDASVQRLMRQLADLGDRAGALRGYQEFAQRLRADLDLDPDRETAGLASQIRAMEAAAPASVPGAEQSVATVPHLVLVGPIHFRGTDRYAYLGPALTELLASTIHGAGPYRTVDPSIVIANPAGSDLPGAVGQRFGAAHHVSGTIIEAGGRLRAAITLTGTEAGSVARLEEDAEAESDVFDLADRLSRRILSSLGVSVRLPVNSTGVRMTHSLRAIRSWMTGEYAFREGKTRDAVSALRDVVREDPEFALAHYRLGCAMASVGMLPDAQRAMDQAASRQERLSDHDRRLVAAHRAWLAGELAEADLGADTLVLGYPESLQGWFLLGDIRFHGNPDRGRSVVESRHAFERVLELDPEHTGALLHLARLDAIERHPEQASARIDRLLTLRPDADNTLALRALRAFLIEDADGQKAVLNALPRASGFAMVDAFVEVAVTARNLPGAERLGRAMLVNAQSDQFRALCHVAVAHVLHASGRIDDAFAELEALPALRAGWAVGARALLRTLPFVTTPREALERDRDILLHAVPPEPPSILPPLLEIHDALSAHLRQFLLGLLNARLGNEPALLQAIEQLSELALPQGASRLLEYMDRTLRAELLRARGRPREALDALGPARRSLSHQAAMFSPVFAGVHHRALRAALLADLGRTAEAEAWWRCMAERSPFELVVRARGPLTLK